VKIAETRDLEDELQRVKAENAELQRRVSELVNIDAAKKKAESKAEQLEEKASLTDRPCSDRGLTSGPDGRGNSGASCSERE
jgi:hypothetical protein